jgi:hypothetical protein
VGGLCRGSGGWRQNRLEKQSEAATELALRGRLFWGVKKHIMPPHIGCQATFFSKFTENRRGGYRAGALIAASRDRRIMLIIVPTIPDVNVLCSYINLRLLSLAHQLCHTNCLFALANAPAGRLSNLYPL